MARAQLLVSEEHADSFQKPVDVTGIGHATEVVPISDKVASHATQAARDAAAEAYEQAGITAEDVGFAEVHDCFTGAEILASKALGLIEDSKGGVATEEGRTTRDGDIPIKPSGGLKAKGHPIGATGIAQIVELTEHLRQDAGKRQIPGVDRSVAHNLGRNAATIVVTVMEARQ